MMEVTGATVDESLLRKLPARFMHQLKELIDLIDPITTMDSLVGGASPAVRMPGIIRAAHTFLLSMGSASS